MNVRIVRVLASLRVAVTEGGEIRGSAVGSSIPFDVYRLT